MKKSISLFLFALFFILFSSKVNALSTCSMERTIELTGLAQNVNVDYEEYKVERGQDVYPDFDEGETISEPGFKVRIYNITDELNVSVVLSGKSGTNEYFHTDADESGVISFDAGYPDKVKNYTISIRSNDSDCQNEVLRKISLTLPVLNKFYTYDVCKENSEYYLCQEYTNVDYSNVSLKQFKEQINEYVKQKEAQQEKESKFGYKLLMFFKRYLWMFITIIVLGVGIYVFIRIRNKQRSK